MAHPLAHHPPSPLPFPMASRPSALGFGFGSPTPRSPFAELGNSSLGHEVGSRLASTPSRSLNQRGAFYKPIRPSASTSASNTAAASSSRQLKRSRRSLSSSSSPSPTPATLASSPPPSPTRRTSDVRSGGTSDAHAVAEDSAMSSPRASTRTKKPRRTQVSTAGVKDVDIGILLATLPPSAHLHILLAMLKNKPELVSQMTPHIPAPDLPMCLTELGKGVDAVMRGALQGQFASGTVVWTRVEGSVLNYCRTALTYLTFFRSYSTTQPDLGTLYHLGHATTHHLLSFLALLPSDVAQSPATEVLSSLANSLIAFWTDWTGRIHNAVNINGEMFPHSTAASWVDGLTELVTRNSFPPLTAAGNSQHVTAFLDELSPIQNRFLSQIGWLVGRSLP